jgi:hypothetical protein
MKGFLRAAAGAAIMIVGAHGLHGAQVSYQGAFQAGSAGYAAARGIPITTLPKQGEIAARMLKIDWPLWSEEWDRQRQVWGLLS